MRKKFKNTIRELMNKGPVLAMASILLSVSQLTAMIFSPPPASYLDGPGIIKIDVENGDAICGRYLQNPDAEFTILYNHGNNEDIGMNLHWLQRFRERGFSVLTYDYRGFGLSEGKSTEKNTYSDAQAAYDYLVKVKNIPPSRIIVMGRSLGGGVAVELASTNPVAGLIMQSTFISINRVVAGGQAVPFDKYKSISRIDNVNCPILVIHGTADSLVKFWHGEKLYEAAQQPKAYLWVEGADHEDDIAAIAGEKYWQAIESFTDKINNGRVARN
ncbi:MAG: alpha/beta hydrolase [Phycisphaerae bacterium]|nr:alpha/beta hydrolase [Phycisphaerae bacterium]